MTFDRIVCEPDLLDGEPHVRGTRLTVRSVLERLAQGRDRYDLVLVHPELDDQSISQALAYAASALPGGKPTAQADGSRAGDLRQLLQDKRGDILRLAAKHGASNVRVFGSVARGDADFTSDIDLLVTLEPGQSLLDHVALWRDLEALLGRKVDVVTEGGLKARLRDRVLREAVPV